MKIRELMKRDKLIPKSNLFFKVNLSIVESLEKVKKSKIEILPLDNFKYFEDLTNHLNNC